MVAGIAVGADDLGVHHPRGSVDTIMEAVGEGIVLFDSALTVLDVNRAAERILGRPRRQLVGRDRRSARIRFLREDGRPWREADAMLEVMVAGGEPIVQLACRVLRPDRSFADVVANARRLVGDGKQLNVLLTLTDVTARRRAEIASREAEERMRAIFDSALDALVAVDAKGAIAEFNAAAEDMFRTPRQAMLGRQFEDLMSERDREANRLLRARFLANPAKSVDRRGLTGVARRADGEEFPVEVSMTSFVESGRRVLSVALRDLSERDRADSASRESEAKFRFMGAITHELRTPLNSILGFGQLLEREETGPLSDRQRRYLHHVLASGHHLLAMIDDLLDLSRLGAGELVLETEDFDVAACCQEALQRLRARSVGTSIEIALEVPDGLLAHADPVRTGQILDHLVSNALKFTPHAGSIRISGERMGAEVVVRVSDTGIGIPQDRQEEIFRDFTQLDHERNRSYEGAGIGLSVSRRLAEAMRGSVSVESEFGRGSTFTLTLPQAR